MNLKQRLEERSARGTPIGSTALMSRIESKLAAPRRVTIAQPGLGFVAGAVATLLLVGGILLALRPDSAPTPPADTTSTTTVTTTTTLPQVTTVPPTSTAPLDLLENRRFVWNWDPATGNLDELRAALEYYDASPYDLIRLVDEGDLEIRRIVLGYLERPSAWNVQTLVLMDLYGSPRGSAAEPMEWSDIASRDIAQSLAEAARNTFGDEANLLLELQRRQAEQTLALCPETDACDWPIWYGIPEVVSAITGEQTELTYVGTMTITSDTGEASSYPFTAEYRDRWTIVELGQHESQDTLSIGLPSVMVVTSAETYLWGQAPLSATVTVERRLVGSAESPDERPIAVDPDSGYWTTEVWDSPPQPGLYDIRIHAALPEGETQTKSVLIHYVPDATRQFAFIRGIDTSGSEPGLVVDYAEMLTGEDAVQAAIADGELPEDQAEEGLPNDYYIRNRNPQLRTLPFGPDAPIYLFDYTIGGEFDYDDVSLDQLVGIMEGGDETRYYGGVTDSPVWIVVLDDVILALEPQYLP